ncbi:uncharacterized protein sh3bp5lb [Chiloscyllium punctatum]|uniref:uncharacterized protein sh3bp5lb n=1 Tax=Chiloscyllium punctatum TaxID=137246 RepID=UPI003B63D18C
MAEARAQRESPAGNGEPGAGADAAAAQGEGPGLSTGAGLQQLQEEEEEEEEARAREREEEEELDPRIQEELEHLNQASEEINKLELQLNDPFQARQPEGGEYSPITSDRWNWALETREEEGSARMSDYKA